MSDSLSSSSVLLSHSQHLLFLLDLLSSAQPPDPSEVQRIRGALLGEIGYLRGGRGDREDAVVREMEQV